VKGEDVTIKMQSVHRHVAQFTIKGTAYSVSIIYLATFSVGAELAVSMLSYRVTTFNAQARSRFEEDM